MIIYTDGGYSIPKNKGGWGFIVTKSGKRVYQEWGIEENSTSHRMELTAFLQAMIYCDNNNFKDIVIKTDSKYVSEGYKIWINDWVQKDWKKSNNKLIKNKDLWEVIYDLKSEYISAKWIKGHSKQKTLDAFFNNEADKLTRNY
mgnify:CR=1 FL=1